MLKTVYQKLGNPTQPPKDDQTTYINKGLGPILWNKFGRKKPIFNVKLQNSLKDFKNLTGKYLLLCKK